ncbi:MAG TPA: hypothetical protein VH140_01060 [Candidatus Acidoferrum sp.]|nr:hypothetical protein [Candidatus Acidoferrum sp.]
MSSLLCSLPVTANTKVEISKDGKVTTITSKGTDSTSFVAVYDKQ